MITRAVIRPVLRSVARGPFDGWGSMWPSGLPRLNLGEKFLTDNTGAYLTDDTGAYLTGEEE